MCIRDRIYCERKSHKGIIIGKSGAMLKEIGSTARFEIQKPVSYTHLDVYKRQAQDECRATVVAKCPKALGFLPGAQFLFIKGAGGFGPHRVSPQQSQSKYLSLIHI